MPKILIIDDDKDFVFSMELVLKNHGYAVETAFTPADGIDRVLTATPDLVILDVIMPTGYEGFEVARSIRENNGLLGLPILMLSNVHSVKQVSYRFAPDKDYLPVDVFLDKPSNPEDVLDTIEEILGERREEPTHPL